jgi:Flp pilus assembly protein TadG
MRRTFQANRLHAQRGAIAVEAALVLPILVIILLFPSIFWALYFYKYSAAQKAVHDAALYLSTAPRLEMTAAGPDGSPVALTLAKKIILKELGGQLSQDPGIICTYQQVSGALVGKPCSTTNNQDYKQALVQLDVSIDVSYIDPLTGMDSGIRISPYADVPYLGN